MRSKIACGSLSTIIVAVPILSENTEPYCSASSFSLQGSFSSRLGIWTKGRNILDVNISCRQKVSVANYWPGRWTRWKALFPFAVAPKIEDKVASKQQRYEDAQKLREVCSRHYKNRVMCGLRCDSCDVQLYVKTLYKCLLIIHVSKFPMLSRTIHTDQPYSLSTPILP